MKQNYHKHTIIRAVGSNAKNNSANNIGQIKVYSNSDKLHYHKCKIRVSGCNKKKKKKKKKTRKI